jgi:hypothetical protein
MQLPDAIQDELFEIIGALLVGATAVLGYLGRATLHRIDRLEDSVTDLKADISEVQMCLKAAEVLQTSIERLEELHTRQFELLHQSQIRLHERVDRILMRTPCDPEYRHYDDLDVRDQIKARQAEDRRRKKGEEG